MSIPKDVLDAIGWAGIAAYMAAHAASAKGAARPGVAGLAIAAAAACAATVGGLPVPVLSVFWFAVACGGLWRIHLGEDPPGVKVPAPAEDDGPFVPAKDVAVPFGGLLPALRREAAHEAAWFVAFDGIGPCDHPILPGDFLFLRGKFLANVSRSWVQYLPCPQTEKVNGGWSAALRRVQVARTAAPESFRLK